METTEKELRKVDPQRQYLWVMSQQYPTIVTDMADDSQVTRYKNDKN